jgi:hypothetical protein
MHSGSNDAQIISAHVNNVTWMELSAASQLGLTIDGHLTARDQELGLSSARGDTSKLQHLAKADHVAGDFDHSLHAESISARIRISRRRGASACLQREALVGRATADSPRELRTGHGLVATISVGHHDG